jgi:YfdX protein
MNAYSLMHGGPRSVRHNFGLVPMLAAAVLAWSAASSEAATAGMATTNTYGSGKLYTTSVERQTEGDLSAEDLHQASLLTSQLLGHVNKATHLLADSQTDSARAEMERAESLLKVVRGLLPTTVVTTTVRDAQGKEIYSEVDRVQDDQIPIFEGQVALEVVEPIVEAKRDEAALKGLKLAEADVIRTSVLVDLGFVERKLKRATELIAKPKEASDELAQSQ